MIEKITVMMFFMMILITLFMFCSVESRFNKMQNQIDYLMEQNVEIQKKQRVTEQDVILLEKGIMYLEKEKANK